MGFIDDLKISFGWYELRGFIRRRQSYLLPVDAQRVFRLSKEPSDAEIREVLERWLRLLVAGDYEGAAVAFQFPRGYTAKSLRRTITTFFGPKMKSDPVAPTAEILARTEIDRKSLHGDRRAFLGFFVPRRDTTAIWATAAVKPYDDGCIIEFEIFHL